MPLIVCAFSFFPLLPSLATFRSLWIAFHHYADIRQQADACLAEFLREITEVVAVDFGPMVVILVEQCQGADKPGIWCVRHACVTDLAAVALIDFPFLCTCAPFCFIVQPCHWFDVAVRIHSPRPPQSGHVLSRDGASRPRTFPARSCRDFIMTRCHVRPACLYSLSSVPF